MRKQLMTISTTAREQVKNLIQKRGKETTGVRISIRTRGCSGLSYTLEFVDTAIAFDEVIDCETFKIFIDPKAVMFLLGTQMDYQETDLEKGFTFQNPNEKGRCGCGESFHV